MSDRGIKKWAPYKSLPEKDIHDLRMKNQKNFIEKPLISNEEAEEINHLLLNHNQSELIFTVYKNGKLFKIQGIIKNIDEINKIIYLESRERILIKDIISLKNNF